MPTEKQPKRKVTGQQRVFADMVARGVPKAVAARDSGYSRPGSAVAKAPSIQAEILRRQREIMATELLPLAVGTLRDVMLTSKLDMARIAAAKAVLDRVDGVAGPDAKGGANLQPHEMSAEQLAAAIVEAERRLLADETEANTIDLEAVQADEDDPLG